MTQAAQKPKPQYPLFELYGIEAIAAKTGYSLYYLLNVKDGSRPANPKFRRLCALGLRRQEESLFGPKGGS